MRTVLIGLAILVTLACVAVLIRFPFLPPLYVVAFWCLVVVAGLAAERYRYKPIVAAEHAPPGWRPTGEAFVDPGSGVPISVWFCPETGERAYVRRETTGRSGPCSVPPRNGLS